MITTRRLGWTGLEVSRIGFGAAGLSLPGRPDDATQLAVLREILQAGVNLIDTADTYCLGPDDLHHNERLIARALIDSPGTHVATKGGTLRTATGWEVDGEPERLYQSIVASHAAFGGRAPLFLWQHHWPDPRYTVVESLRPVRRAVDEGLIRFVGVCNYSLEQVQQALDLVPLVTIQNQFNLWHREAESDGLLKFCEEHGLIFLPYRPLGGGELSQRLVDVPTLARIGQRYGISPHRVVLAWLLQSSTCVLPIPGTRSIAHFRDLVSAVSVTLADADIDAINSLTPEQLPQLSRRPRWIAHPPLSFRP